MENERNLQEHLLSTHRGRPAWVNPTSIAWGVPDHDTGILAMYDSNGLWFAFDMVTGKDINFAVAPTPVDWVAQLHAMADQVKTVSKCYFIGSDEGPIKIGHSVNAQDRLRAFQQGCPVKLSLLATAPGGVEREAAYHAQFYLTRSHGEWFERTPELLAEIDRLKGSE